MSSEDDRIKTERLHDKRTLDRNLRKGLVSPKEVEKITSALPDLQDKVAPPPPELTFTPAPVASSGPSIPIYTITRAPKDTSVLDDDDDLDDEDDDDLDDEDDDDLDDEDEEKDAEKSVEADLPEAG
jgi:hypothetical protein